MSDSLKIGIGAVEKATGIREATLRSWESRYGFPVPEREPGGHRRYSAEQVDQIRRVAHHRELGLSMSTAIARVRPTAPAQAASIFARLRESRPELVPQPMNRRHVVRLAKAIEDESAARAESGVLIGAFQREANYRESEKRWRDLARGGLRGFVLADFRRVRTPAGAPAEIPIEDSEPMRAEWSLICIARGHSACLIARERPGQDEGNDKRIFEGFLSVEPEVVREAAEIAVRIAEPIAPEVVAGVRARLEAAFDADPSSQLRLSGAITSRFLAALE